MSSLNFSIPSLGKLNEKGRHLRKRSEPCARVHFALVSCYLFSDPLPGESLSVKVFLSCIPTFPARRAHTTRHTDSAEKTLLCAHGNARLRRHSIVPFSMIGVFPNPHEEHATLPENPPPSYRRIRVDHWEADKTTFD